MVLKVWSEGGLVFVVVLGVVEWLVAVLMVLVGVMVGRSLGWRVLLFCVGSMHGRDHLA